MKRDILALAAVSALVLLWNLGAGSVCSWDEGVYGSVAKEILETGDWINLHWRGVAWSDKPPLYMWVTAFFYKYLGFNEFSLRLFSAISGIGTILSVYLLGHRLYGRKAAVASSLTLLSTYHFIWSSRMGMLDMTLTFFITLSLLFFKLGEDRRGFLFLSPLAFAFAFLTKGMGAALVPLILAAYIVVTARYRLLLDKWLISGSVLALSLLLWWHWAAFSSYGGHFVKGYFFRHLIHRTTTSLDGHTGNALTYFGVIPNKGRPWALIGFLLVPLMALRAYVGKEKQHILPLTWFSVVFVLFSLVGTKLHWYIIPLYPPLALFTGWLFAKLFKKRTVPVAATLSACSLLLLGMTRDVFDLDYSPGIKSFAVRTEELLPENEMAFMYAINDPGMQFYFQDSGVNVQERGDFLSKLRTPGTYAVLNTAHISIVSGIDHTVLLRNEHHTLIRSE